MDVVIAATIAPRVLEHVELQRDRRADHGVLPLERDAERAYPVTPVRRRLFEEAPADVRDASLHRLVRPEQHGHGVLEVERILLCQGGNRRVRGEPQHEIGTCVADVIRAARGLRRGAPVALGGTQAHADAGIAGDPPDPAHQHHGTEHPAVLLEAGSEIGDLDARPGAVVQPGDEDRRIDEILLLGTRRLGQLHDEEPEVRFTLALAQQRAEGRVAVEMREAPPHDLAQRIHQSADRSVPDQGEVERAHAAAPPAPPAPCAPCCSHARTAPTSRRRQRAWVRPGPTFTEWPCRRLTVAKPYSSVESSPTNTGVRPRNGSSCMNSSTAAPLSLPAGLISTTRLPPWMPNVSPFSTSSERASRCA